MRKILIATLFAGIAAPAFATDSGDAAFELLSQYTAEKHRKNFIKLQSDIDMADAMAIDAKFSELYGLPEISRSGLKVWEIENTSGRGAKLTTLMCGPDGKGGIFISADRRGKAMNRMPKGQEGKRKKRTKSLANSVSTQKPKSAERD